MQFTNEQKKYIKYNKIEDTKLIATAGGSKTTSLIHRMNYIIESNLLKCNEILMLTFSRFTRDDFLHRIKKYNIKTVNEKYVKTIDSFAKNLIDENNEIDVSLLSFKFLKYLKETSSDKIKSNKKLNSIKCIFVDEAQDLNKIQYEILILLKEKNGTVINLIGDPNQNIYQFRKSSDKYLMNFKATTFYLTQNFRSYDPVLNFSSFLRPVKVIGNNEIIIKGNLGKSDCLPNIIFHQDDSELETHIITILDYAKNNNVNFSDIAILAPTRGRMRGFGRSNGLCLISNLLYKNNFKFKQFYEETNDSGSDCCNIKYEPQSGHINVLTYMGSKGLEWKFVILIDADTCLINKRHFTEDKHKNDQYLLYVACSRAIENIIIFSKYRFCEGNLTFQFNPWFNIIPKEYYELDRRFTKFFKYQKLKFNDIADNEKRITKIMDKFDEETLDNLSEQIMSSGYKKEIIKIYDKDFSVTINSNMFLGKYVENLFIIYYQMKKKLDKKKYYDIENIIDNKIITDVPVSVSEWFYINRNHLNWELFEQEKKDMKLDNIIIETVEERFDKTINLQDHTIVNDGYFKSFILSMKNIIKDNYEKYLKTEDTDKIKKYLFNIIVLIYSLETQHYYHAKSNGKKFKPMLDLCNELFDRIKHFAYTTDLNFVSNNVLVNKFGIFGEIDLIDDNKNIWEIKCTSDISLRNTLQVLMYNIIYHDCDTLENCQSNFTKISAEKSSSKKDILSCNTEKVPIKLNFINFLKGEIIKIEMNFSRECILEIIKVFSL